MAHGWLVNAAGRTVRGGGKNVKMFRVISVPPREARLTLYTQRAKSARHHASLCMAFFFSLNREARNIIYYRKSFNPLMIFFSIF